MNRAFGKGGNDEDEIFKIGFPVGTVAAAFHSGNPFGDGDGRLCRP
jgi:hypothetical protein